MEAVDPCITVLLFIIAFVFTCLSLFLLLTVTDRVTFDGGKGKKKESGAKDIVTNLEEE